MTTASRIMNATYNEQGLGKLLSLATVRARTSRSAACCGQRVARPRTPAATAVRATRLSIRREQGAALDICVETTELVRSSHRNAESQEHGS